MSLENTKKIGKLRGAQKMLSFMFDRKKKFVCDFRKFVCAQRDHKKEEKKKKRTLGWSQK